MNRNKKQERKGHGAAARTMAAALSALAVQAVRADAAECYAKFADEGRYLPPVGLRAVAVESTGLTNFTGWISRVPSENLVEMLALEERAYRRIRRNWWQEADEIVEDLAAEAEKVPFRCEGKPGVTETSVFRVKVADGGNRNGIYLLSVPGKDRWGGEARNYRVVCVTDLGLSVRRIGDTVGVWVTSLSTGLPVPDIAVETYSAANVRLGTGATDARGWCTVTRTAKGEVFTVVAKAADGADMSFVALRDSSAVDETPADGARDRYLGPDEIDAWVWTERGIYRHGEPIFVQALLRNGKGVAPAPRTFDVLLKAPSGKAAESRRLASDENGVLRCEDFSVAAERPSGTWRIEVREPGKGASLLGAAAVRIEEFVPPQVKVAVDCGESAAPSNFAFAVRAERLYGGPASFLGCEGAVSFADVPFAPTGWKGFRFGNDDLGLKANFDRIKGKSLDRKGECVLFSPARKDLGLPKAAVRVTAQGTVFERGGRPANGRKSLVLHHYPSYIGTTLPDWLRRPQGARPSVAVACVNPDGSRCASEKRLVATVERVETTYAYRRNARGWITCDCERKRIPVVTNAVIATSADADAEFVLPLDECGDYVLTVEDPAGAGSFSRTFYLSDWGDDAVRTPRGNPTKVTLVPDRPFYRPGETPHLVVKAPFAGAALVSVMRDDLVWTDVVTLGGPTGEIALPPVTAAEAPGLDVSVSVVQAAGASARRLAMRAHGFVSIGVRRAEDELTVGVRATVSFPDNPKVSVEVSAPGATEATVALVDEGISLLTDEPEPDPAGFFARLRTGRASLNDLYNRILPAFGDEVFKNGGVKIGGGGDGDMFGRVSPVGSRRFKPLSAWKAKVPVVNGAARADFDLPDFAGEVRISAIAWNARGSGAGCVRTKVHPKLVMQCDAPRFVAPGDEYDITQTLAASDGSYVSNLVTRVRAPSAVGTTNLVFAAAGFGERHEQVIELPVRPAVPWRETAGVRRLEPGETPPPKTPRFTYDILGSQAAQLKGAYDWLAEYPHGCLEQTGSRIFPLLASGDDAHRPYVEAGVKRVLSMLRENDFTMWPDVNCAPWDPEVSIYAAHFLFEAERNGFGLDWNVRGRLLRILGRWAMSTNGHWSAYACHTLSLAGSPELDRMHQLYDRRADLDLVSRARLARAFVLAKDPVRAQELLKGALAPDSVKEAAFATLALLELDPGDPRLPGLAAYLTASRGRERLCWGTTSENAHALLALGAYFKAHPADRDARFLAWRKLELPDASEVRAESNVLGLTRRFLDADGKAFAGNAFNRGDLVIVELTLTTSEDRSFSDLVVEDLFPAAFEPAPREFVTSETDGFDWVMRSDARDDRMLVFSKRFRLGVGEKAVFRYPVRVVSTGRYALPGASVEAMYAPALRARTELGKIVSEERPIPER